MLNRKRYLIGGIVGFLVISLGIALRLLVILDQQRFVWLDELHTAWVISGEFSDVMPRAMIGNQSPLFFWVQYWLVPRQSITALTIRIPVLLISLATIVTTLIVVWKMTKSRYALLLAACVISLDSFWIFYATEARPFVAVQWIATIQVFLFWRIYLSDRQVDTRWQVGFILSSAVLFYLHYTAALLLVVEWCYVVVSIVLIQVRKKDIPSEFLDASRNRLRRLLIHSLCLSPLLAAGTIQVVGIAENHMQWSSFATGTEFWFQLRPLWIGYVLIPGIMLAAAWLIQALRPDRQTLIVIKKLPLLFACSVFLGPIVIALVVSSVPSPFGEGPLLALGHIRYVVVSLAAAPVFVGVVVASMRSRNLRFIAVTVIGISILVFNQSFFELLTKKQISALRNERWGIIASQVNIRSKQSGLQCPVFLFANLVEDGRLSDQDVSEPFVEYCRFPLTNEIIALKKPNQQIIARPTFGHDRFSQQHVETIIREGGVFLVVRGSWELLVEISRELIDEMESTDFRLKMIGRIVMPQSDVVLIEFAVVRLQQ